eukprot:TRINITY_DN2108_c0_g1_i5.p2 TRINITY_DN2108_c0_g1~~TRINITY_DN2108_c0_g1_i5.p2  ORF type:complete len:286 (+),score=57.48 TRINITY_DN2108_c0_g1_i5:1077-1934(+)
MVQTRQGPSHFFFGSECHVFLPNLCFFVKVNFVGIDSTHNPEFTTCEFYSAYTEYTELMTMTEDFLRGLVFSVFGTHEIAIPNLKNKGETVVVDFNQPFRRISILEELVKNGINYDKLMSSLKTNGIPGLTEELKKICLERDIPLVNDDKECSSAPELFDEIIGKYVESQCVQPTFILDHPILTSPLAKEHRCKPGIVERFELFMGGIELCNAYTELNDPVEQKIRFDMQTDSMKALGFVKTPEALKSESEYVQVLEYGLPPTGGWGLGIDRLVMLLSGKTSIRV